MSIENDRRWLAAAVELSGRCPPSATAFSVGAIIVDADGQAIATGYSRDSDPHIHAEESALGKLTDDDPRLKAATIYSSLEPCTVRRSRPRTCTELIIASGIPRVVFAWREPALLVADCQGAEELDLAGLTVTEIEDLAPLVKAANGHLFTCES